MSNKSKWMCSNCDTEHDSQVGAIYCCQCESCAELKKQLEAVREVTRDETMPKYWRRQILQAIAKVKS